MANEKDFKIKNGLILNNDNSGARLSRDGNYLRNTTQHGRISLGPNNAGFAHIDTDRSNFYFNRKLTVDQGIVQSYNENLVLRYYENSDHQLTISTSEATFAGNLVVTGNLTINGSTVTNSSTNTTIEDALIELGSGNTGTNSNDLGLILERGSTGNNVFIGWDESEDKVAFGTTTATGSSTGNISYSRASIIANSLDLTNHIDMADSARIRLGNSDDLQLFHDGTSSIIDNATGHLDIKNGANDADIRFFCDDQSGGLDEYLRLDGGDGRIKTFRNIRVRDEMFITFGDSDDLQIRHDASNSSIANFTGNLLIKNSTDDGDIIFQCDDGSGGLATYFRLDGSLSKTFFHQNIQTDDNVRVQ